MGLRIRSPVEEPLHHWGSGHRLPAAAPHGSRLRLSESRTGQRSRRRSPRSRPDGAPARIAPDASRADSATTSPPDPCSPEAPTRRARGFHRWRPLRQSQPATRSRRRRRSPSRPRRRQPPGAGGSRRSVRLPTEPAVVPATPGPLCRRPQASVIVRSHHRRLSGCVGARRAGGSGRRKEMSWRLRRSTVRPSRRCGAGNT